MDGGPGGQPPDRREPTRTADRLLPRPAVPDWPILHPRPVCACGLPCSTPLSGHEKGYRFTGIVSDGGTGIRNAVIRMYGAIPHQICMAHIHRQAVNGLGKYPKEEKVRQLKQLANHMWLIESQEAREWWKNQINQWIKTHGLFIGETRWDTSGHWWYIHGGVRKCVRSLKTAYEDCFTFLDHPLMPKTSNEIEATIGNLSMKHLIHRGMKQENLQILKMKCYRFHKYLGLYHFSPVQLKAIENKMQNL